MFPYMEIMETKKLKKNLKKLIVMFVMMNDI